MVDHPSVGSAVTPVVVDASVTAAWCFQDEATDASRALHRSLPHRQVVVPLLWHAECANLLLTAERRRRLSTESCSELLDLLGELPIETDDETAHIRGPVIRLARTHRLTVYDAIYLDLAMRRGIALATRENDLRRAAASLNVTLIQT
ncbi:type II toxin-antitoxin system VapC family toxin [Rhodopila sp.]|uniref:type II toxin-antitoxin system VapC family toxin n=1 Tax=Rhodopila sp. TaxID=2480087 RepID=UPI003D0F91B1